MRKILVQLGAFVVAGFLLWGLVAWRDRQMLERLRNEMAIAGRDSSIARQTDTLFVRDIFYLRGRTEFRAVAANPSSTKADVINSCSEALRRCDVVRATNDTLRDSLKAQVEALRKMKERKPPRFSAFAAAGYDFLNAKAIGQVGADFRVLGPLSLTGFLESGPGVVEKIDSRGVIALKFVFR